MCYRYPFLICVKYVSNSLHGFFNIQISRIFKYYYKLSMKKILYVIASIISVYLILCLFGPSETFVERSIQINSSPETIKNKLTDYQFFHEKWSPWTEKDPNMKKTYSGVAGMPEHQVSWQSENDEVGKGSLTYKFTHGDTVMHILHFDGMESDGHIYHVVKANNNGSDVKWIMQDPVPFQWRVMMLFFNMDKMIGPDFEKGLKKLKIEIESNS